MYKTTRAGRRELLVSCAVLLAAATACTAPAPREASPAGVPDDPFAFLDGDFDVAVEIPLRDGSVTTRRARSLAWVVPGSGLRVEVFDHAAAEEKPFTSFRIHRFDDSSETWRVDWYDSAEKRLQEFRVLPADDGRVVMLSEGPQPGRVDRITWRATDTPRPSWSYELSGDAGETFREHARATYGRVRPGGSAD